MDEQIIKPLGLPERRFLKYIFINNFSFSWVVI